LTINYSNGKKHNLAVYLNNNINNCEERLVEQRKVSILIIIIFEMKFFNNFLKIDLVKSLKRTN
jgi:hypothetical protein